MTGVGYGTRCVRPPSPSMFFFPYRFERELLITPLLTILISLTCLFVYRMQADNELEVGRSIGDFCAERLNRYDSMMLARIGRKDPEQVCRELLVRTVIQGNREALFDKLAHEALPLAGYEVQVGERMSREFLADTYARYAGQAPKFRTGALWYPPHGWHPLAMLTATIAHGSWAHVIGNLFFFFAFAAAVEAVIGTLAFIGTYVILAVGTHAVYSLAMLNVPDALPTLGLSGVVMGMMGLLTYLAPKARIKCFYWLLLRFGNIAIPAWMLFAWYAGWDIYHLVNSDSMGGVNLVAHVSGAAIGYGTGMLLFRGDKRLLALEVE